MLGRFSHCQFAAVVDAATFHPGRIVADRAVGKVERARAGVDDATAKETAVLLVTVVPVRTSEPEMLMPPPLSPIALSLMVLKVRTISPLLLLMPPPDCPAELPLIGIALNVVEASAVGPHSPRGEKSEDSSWTSPKTSLRGLREDYALCGGSGCGPRQPLAATNCQVSYWSQSGTLVRWSLLNCNSVSQLHADLLAQLPGLGR